MGDHTFYVTPPPAPIWQNIMLNEETAIRGIVMTASFFRNQALRLITKSADS